MKIKKKNSSATCIKTFRINKQFTDYRDENAPCFSVVEVLFKLETRKLLVSMTEFFTCKLSRLSCLFVRGIVRGQWATCFPFRCFPLHRRNETSAACNLPTLTPGQDGANPLLRQQSHRFGPQGFSGITLRSD